jgi:hypothetical protein
MANKIQLRRDTAASWTTNNPTLSQGEPGLETDTFKIKYGDGTTPWNSLSYPSGSSYSLPTATTSVLGGVKVDGTTITVNNGVISAASQGGSYNNITLTGTTTVQEITEVVNTKTGATGVVTHDYATGSIFYHSNIISSFTVNLINVPNTTNRTVTLTLVLQQGGTNYIPNGFQINGTSYSIGWAGGITPSGVANKINYVTFFLLNVNSTWTVNGNLSSYG